MAPTTASLFAFHVLFRKLAKLCCTAKSCPDSHFSRLYCLIGCNVYLSLPDTYLTPCSSDCLIVYHCLLKHYHTLSYPLPPSLTPPPAVFPCSRALAPCSFWVRCYVFLGSPSFLSISTVCGHSFCCHQGVWHILTGLCFIVNS